MTEDQYSGASKIQSFPCIQSSLRKIVSIEAQVKQLSESFPLPAVFDVQEPSKLPMHAENRISVDVPPYPSSFLSPSPSFLSPSLEGGTEEGAKSRMITNPSTPASKPTTACSLPSTAWIFDEDSEDEELDEERVWKGWGLPPNLPLTRPHLPIHAPKLKM
jgi:hypothetical protein